jgi:hypothetical protein
MSGQLFLICGDDDYLVQAAAQERLNAIVPEADRTFGLDIVPGRCDNGDQAVKAVQSAMESVQMPGFASSKATWLQDANFLTGGGRASESIQAKEAVAKFSEWIAAGFQPGQHLVITTPKVLKSSIFFKACQKNGEVIDFVFTVCRKSSPQKPQMLRGYLIRLTREYTDGGMDSHAEEEKGVTKKKCGYCYQRR